MVIIKLMGGLGNQMFQYAFAKALAQRRKEDFKLDLSFLLDRSPRKYMVFRNYDLDIFKLEADFANEEDIRQFSTIPPTSIFPRIRHILAVKLNRDHYLEPHFHFAAEAFEVKAHYFEGYWQTRKYFKAVEDDLRKDFEFKNEMSRECLGLKEKIESSNSICVNIRRGDFVSNPKSNQTHGFVGKHFYETSISRMENDLERPHFYIFSDDIEWCRKNIKAKDLTFVDHQYAGEKFSSYLELMSSCQHFIIPNSSFAWWAVWLNRSSSKKVICPRDWFQDSRLDTSDLIPSTWTRI